MDSAKSDNTPDSQTGGDEDQKIPAVAKPPPSHAPSNFNSSDDDDDDDSGDEFDEDAGAGEIYYQQLDPGNRQEMIMADRLSVRLLAAQDDELEEERILTESLQLEEPTYEHPPQRRSFTNLHLAAHSSRGSLTNLHLAAAHSSRGSFTNLHSAHSSRGSFTNLRHASQSSRRFRGLLDGALDDQKRAQQKLQWMGLVAFLAIVATLVALGYGAKAVIADQPTWQPVGPYRLIERQEGKSLFDAYTFYVGKDSVGSNGYNMYVDQEKAERLGIINVTMEDDELDVFYESSYLSNQNSNASLQSSSLASSSAPKKEPFVYVGSAPTEAGPRDSIRLQGNRRFDRGLFILDVRHMPAGCGVWPAFWLVDEPNWPINGEIDIVEGVNYQTEAKTALHSTRGCNMDDVPFGTMTGTWDTAQGIPDKDTGIPDMTLRYAQNCFVYDPHQWLNQGCVAVDQEGGTIGVPLNEKGGGVYVLEWDPINRHIRSWIFTPHTSVPENLVQTIRTASLPPEQQVVPDPDLWPVPYAYFSIGRGTNCASDHFKHMHLVLNTAFCGSVAGNRYQMDCTEEQVSQYPTCKDYIKSKPPEIQDEAYWKIRGVYVYEREWERTLLT